MVTIAVDVMGGDDAPGVVLDGIAQALAADSQLSVCACGPEHIVAPFAQTHERCIPVFASEVIAMGEHPAEAVRTKTDSSIVVGCKLVKDGQAGGFFSAGSTGACLASATLNIGRIKGVKRPAIGTVMPSLDGPTLLIDAGANAECKPEYLVQFARMGALYMNRILGVDNPRVGLLNIGEEEAKGTPFTHETYALIQNEIPGFKGNAEGGSVMKGGFDVIVTDGFTGNVTLKVAEGTAEALLKYVKRALTSTFKAKLGALLVKGAFGKLLAEMSPDNFGGAPLLGVKGACFIGHGSSDAATIKTGIDVTARAVRCGMTEVIAEAFAGGECA